jgi:tRNA threonylcarbamoyladenosine modification (KEOPS) complex  Pcc1 subunit
MNFFANVKILDKNKKLYSALIAEKESLVTPRADVAISYHDLFCVFEIKAIDFASFRAMENAVMRLVTIDQKMQEISK